MVISIRTLAVSIISLVCSVYSITAQVITHPNYAIKSHETLEILRIETTEKASVFFMSIENRIEGGTFCADKNIYILYPDGTRSPMVSSDGIPVCPATYKFKFPGERLDFRLTFPPLKAGTEWIDLIEDCKENCFFFYGVTLDSDLNEKINEAFILVNGTERNKALTALSGLHEDIGGKKHGIEGLFYITIINLAEEKGDKVLASEWYYRLRSSDITRASQFIKYLNDRGIKY